MSSESPAELHLVSRLADQRAWEMCARRAREGAVVRVLLIHDAVLETESSLRRRLGLDEDAPLPLTVLACEPDARSRGVAERWALADYRQIVELCFGSRPVISW